MVGHRAFTRRIGRNESFNHAGNAVAAAAAGGGAFLFGPMVVSYLLAFMSMASLVSILSIPERAMTPGAVAAFAVLVCYFGLAETGGSESSASSGGAAVSSKLAAD